MESTGYGAHQSTVGVFVLQFKYIDQGESSTPYKKWKLKTPRDAFETMDKRYNGKKEKVCSDGRGKKRKENNTRSKHKCGTMVAVCFPV